MDRRPMASDPFGGVQSEIDKEGKSEEKKDGAENPKPTSGSSEEKKSDDAKEDDKEKSEKTDSMESITQQFHQAVGQVDSPIPMNISAAFNMLEIRIDTINKSLLRNKKSAEIAWEKVYPAAYFQLWVFHCLVPIYCHGSTDCNPVYRLPLNLVQSCSCLATDAT